MDKNILDAIKCFLEEDYGIRKRRINIQSRIEKDLRITGDDAVEMLVDFGKKFNVDVSNFMAADYFNGEGSFWFFPMNNTPNKKVLTIGHLVKAVIAGKLDESIVSG